ncbi:MAG: hypothetical protein ACRERU_02790 [Methylococcales bacterium]
MSGKNLTVLLGAGRSGTTLLYKILSAHPRVTYLSNYQNRFPTWPSTALLHGLLNNLMSIKRQSWFTQGGRAYFNEQRAWLKAVIPTPAEAESVYAACGLPLNPSADEIPDMAVIKCFNETFETICRRSGARVLLTKCTVEKDLVTGIQHNVLARWGYLE